MVSNAGPVFALFRQFFIFLFLFLFVSLSSFILFYVLSSSRFDTLSPKYQAISLDNIDKLEVVELPSHVKISTTEKQRCTYWDCFNVYKCGEKGLKRVSVYVYPLKKYVDGSNSQVDGGISKELYSLLKAIINSKYYTADPHEACIFVPSLDTLSYHRYDSLGVSKALATLPFWKGGENHLIWSMIGNSSSDSILPVNMEIGKAMLAGAGFTSWSYRTSFDVALPVFSPMSVKIFEKRDENQMRTVHMLVVQTNINPKFLVDLKSQIRQSSDILILEKCPVGNTSVRCSSHDPKEIYQYPDVLQMGFFCLVVYDSALSRALLLEVMAAGCVPVVVGNSVVLPFQEALDWKRAAIFVGDDELGRIMDVVQSISRARYLEMKRQAEYFYETYFMTMKAIALTTLDILNQRVYPESGQSYVKWNLPPNPHSTQTPLFHQLTARKWQGFTAVVLTYNRVESLFTLIKQLVKVPSLSKIVVIWNNQHKSPPPVPAWPKVSKMIKVIQTKANKLSNRFYPYADIETEAILTIDDDIMMLTPDELEFGFEVWREFPDRIVGFPSRTHVWDNISMHWKYESEWTNEISMVLTGAAFHHKIWSYLYTTSMPGEIKEWVDDHMNCEDIAMNFLVANVTGKAPIKVAPRKKFKCPECTNPEMLSADATHMVERSRCIDRFTSIYGTMPLRSVEFRADPVLYKDTFPGKLKRFNDIGSL